MPFSVIHPISTLPRVILCAARKGHWVLRCAVLPSPSPNFCALVTKQWGELRDVVLCNPLMALRLSTQGLLNSLVKFSQESTFPRKHELMVATQSPSTDCLRENQRKPKWDDPKVTTPRQVIPI